MQRRLASRYILFNKNGSVDASVGVPRVMGRRCGVVQRECRIDPLSNNWPLLVAEQLDGERLVIGELRPRAGAVADLADELVLFVFLSAGQRDGRRAADAVCWLIGETPR
jgi:hypothetical protein